MKELFDRSLLDLFEKLSFSEYVEKIRTGIKEPKWTGDYKWAKFEITRLWSPFSAIFVPLFVLLILCTLAFNEPVERMVVVDIIDPTPIEELDPVPEIEPLPTIQPDVVDFDASFDGNSEFQNDNAAFANEPFSPQPALADTVAIIKSPIMMRRILGSRSPGQKGSAMAKFGAPAGTEGAVMRALRWLKKNQNDDGSWNNVKPAMTGLALLAFLAHGDTPASEEFGYTVQKAIEWLQRNQEGNGHFKDRDDHDYSHPIAAYALAEAYGMTRVPSVRESAIKAIEVILKGQHMSGGWNYNCNHEDRDDTSYMGWCAQALKAAKLAELYSVGDDRLDKAMRRAIKGFKKNYRHGYNGGTFGYTSPGNTGLTGVGVLCLQLLGVPESKEVRNGLMSLEKTTFNWNGGGTYNKNYYWYYITQAKFHAGGAMWNSWNKKFSPVLVGNQTIIKEAILDVDGRLVDIGFWAMNKEITGHTDGVVMDTCLCVLQLEVYYRYLPTFQKPIEMVDDVAVVEDELDINIDI